MSRHRDGPWRALALVAAIALAEIPSVASHSKTDRLDPQDIEGGEAGRYFGSVKGLDEGPLVVTEFVDPSPACGGSELESAESESDGPRPSISFRMGRTFLDVSMNLSEDHAGFVGVAFGNGQVQQSLIMMQEQVVGVHMMAAATYPETGGIDFRTGLLGKIWPVDGENASTGHGGAGDGSNFVLAYDETAWPFATVCGSPFTNRFFFRFDVTEIPSFLRHGSVAHSVILHDSSLPYFLPRPIEESTRVLEFNVYLAREGETLTQIMATFEPRTDAPAWLALSVVGFGVCWALVWWIRGGRPG